ncbi:MAG: DUF1573 domain-containing protein [Bacteroidaceae bacterium]|nr:DUF1573 domain-containing protein [Bacteroidaceae bacterium]
MKRNLIIAMLMLAVGMQAQTLRFDSLALHLPLMYEGDSVAHSVIFRLTNTSAEPQQIAAPVATCGCTQVSYYPRRPIAAGQTDSIVVQFQSDRNAGTVDEPVLIYSVTDDAQPIAKLHVLGTIQETADSKWRHLPASMGPLRLKRKTVTFGASDVVMRIPCANTGAVPLCLTVTLLPPYATLVTDPATIAPGAEADIVVRIDRQRLPALRPLKAAIVLDGVPCDLRDRRISLTIE